MQYWDTSALLKLYIPEPDSGQFTGHVSSRPIYACELSRWEMLRAILRKEVERSIAPYSAEAIFARFLSDVSTRRVVLLSNDTEVEASFRSLLTQLHRRNPPVLIRAFDAIHLATASVLEATEMVSTDVRLRAGAAVIGLALFP
jgi:predicted nucleic acid-binding protein